MSVSAVIFAVWLSLLCAAVAVGLCIVPAVALAWVLARGRFRAKGLIESALLLPLVVPPVVTGYLLLLIFGRRGLLGPLLEPIGIRIAFTWVGAAIAQAVVALPLVVLTVRVAIESVDRHLEEAAQAVGASRLRTFMRVTLPLSWHGVAAGAVLGFARALGEFGATILIAGNIEGRTQTLPLAIYSEANRPGGDATAAGLVILSIALAAAAVGTSQWLVGWGSLKFKIGGRK